MKIRKFLLGPVLAAWLIVVINSAKSAEVTNTENNKDDNLSNADLRHLISILDNGDGKRDGSEATINTTTSTTVKPRKKKLKIRKSPVSTSTASSIPDPTTVSTTPYNPSVSPTTEKEPTSTTVTIPLEDTELHNISPSSVLIQKRQDVSLDTLKEILPPSQQELVSQLSLLNTLLASLGENATSASVHKTVVGDGQEAQTPILNPSDQTLAALNSLLVAAASANNNNNNVNNPLASLSGLLPNSNMVTRQTDASSNADVNKALTDILLQASQQNAGGLGAAANSLNQISSLVSTIGALNSFASQTGQMATSSSNVHPLMAALGQQQQRHSDFPLNQQSQQIPAFDIATLLAAQAQNRPAGSGILSTIGTGLGALGSSLINTVSNVFAPGADGKPKMRGVDTRLGLGYRLGDAMDAQLMWDVRPQIFTDTISNEYRPSMMKRQDGSNPSRSSFVDKIKEKFSAAKRMLQVGFKGTGNPEPLPTPMFQRKPISLLELWNVGKDKQKQKPNLPNASQMPKQLLTTPLNAVDLHQMERNKSFKKRSSLKNYYDKPVDNPRSGHSTLTSYEKMLLNHGTDLGVDGQEVLPRRTPKRRKRPPPPPKSVIPDGEIMVTTTEPTPTRSPGDESYDQRNKKHHKKKKQRRRKKKKPYHMKTKLPNDNHKWKPRGNLDDEEGKPSKSRSKEENDYSRSRETFRQSHEYQDYKSQENDRGMMENEEYYSDQEEPRFDREQLNEETENHYIPMPTVNHFETHGVPLMPEDMPMPSRDDFLGKPQSRFETDDDISYSESNAKYNYEEGNNENNDHHDRDYSASREKHRHHNEEEDDDIPDGEGEYEPPPSPKPRRRRPKPKPSSKERDMEREKEHGYRNYKPPPSNKKHRPVPQHYEEDERSVDGNHKKHKRPKFSLAKIFHYWVGGKRKRGRNPNNPEDENRRREDNEPFERFTYKQPSLHSKDKTENEKRRKNRRKRPKKGPRSGKSNKRITFRAGLPFEEDYEDEEEIPAESNESFLKRNKVQERLTSLNSHLKNKLTLPHSEAASGSDLLSDQFPLPSPSANPASNIMSFVRNYMSSKSRSKHRYPQDGKHPSNSMIPKGSRRHPLSQLISNPSSLNPLKILPMRRDRLQNKKKSTSTTTTTSTTPTPLIHIGDDMSFDQLTDVFPALKKGKKKFKLKVKGSSNPTPSATPSERKRFDLTRDEEEEEDDDYSNEDDIHLSIMPGDQKSESSAKIENVADTNNNNAQEEDEDTKDQKDGVRGIYIDFESGEVHVMKPVAELTSFEPTTQPPPPVKPVLDLTEDLDGDGIPDLDIIQKHEIFSGIQTELKKNYDQMRKSHQAAEAKRKRTEALKAQGYDETVDVVSKYFDMVEGDADENEEFEGSIPKPKNKKKKN